MAERVLFYDLFSIAQRKRWENITIRKKKHPEFQVESWNVNEPTNKKSTQLKIAAFNFFLSSLFCIFFGVPRRADFKCTTWKKVIISKKNNNKRNAMQHRKLLNQFCNTPILQSICFMCWNPKPKEKEKKLQEKNTERMNGRASAIWKRSKKKRCRR